MDDYTLILIMIGMAATLILSAIFIWHAFIWRSWGRLINLFMSVFLNSQDVVDPYKKIEPSKEIPRSAKLKERAEEFEAQFDTMALNAQSTQVQKAHIPEQEQSEFARDTSDSGWPRALTPEERQDPRPFRNVHIYTENEELLADANEQAETDD
jgi:hypothetical protein